MTAPAGVLDTGWSLSAGGGDPAVGPGARSRPEVPTGWGYAGGMILVVVALVLLLVVGLPLAGFALVSLVGLLLSGLVIGGLGRLLVPGRQPIGLPATVLVGIVGALVGTVVGHEVHLDGLVTVLLEVVAAAVLVVGVARTGLARRLGRSRTRALPRGQ